jgi:hypothetical protein
LIDCRGSDSLSRSHSRALRFADKEKGNDVTVHARILAVSHTLEEELQRMAMPCKAPNVMQVDWARQFASQVTMAAFDGNIPHDFGATHVTPEELAALLPEFEGALKIVTAMRQAGVIYPPRKFFERIVAAFQPPKVG